MQSSINGNNDFAMRSPESSYPRGGDIITEGRSFGVRPTQKWRKRLQNDVVDEPGFSDVDSQGDQGRAIDALKFVKGFGVGDADVVDSR